MPCIHFIALPANATVPITVYATIAQDTNGTLDGSTAQVNLLPNSTNIVALDSNNNLVQVSNSGPILGGLITFN